MTNPRWRHSRRGRARRQDGLEATRKKVRNLSVSATDEAGMRAILPIGFLALLVSVSACSAESEPAEPPTQIFISEFCADTVAEKECHQAAAVACQECYTSCYQGPYPGLGCGCDGICDQSCNIYDDHSACIRPGYQISVFAAPIPEVEAACGRSADKFVACTGDATIAGALWVQCAKDAVLYHSKAVEYFDCLAESCSPAPGSCSVPITSSLGTERCARGCVECAPGEAESLNAEYSLWREPFRDAMAQCLRAPSCSGVNECEAVLREAITTGWAETFSLY